MIIPDRDASGKIIYATDKAAGDFSTVVTHNFCDNTTWIIGTSDSTWDLAASAGTILRVAKAEVQFEHDLNIGSDDIYLDYYVWHPASPGTPVLGQRITFDSVRSMFELGNEHYHAPSLPEIASGLTTIVFNYANKLSFYGDETYGELAYLRISVKDHAQVTGSYATVGFVTHSESV